MQPFEQGSLKPDHHVRLLQYAAWGSHAALVACAWAIAAAPAACTRSPESMVRHFNESAAAEESQPARVMDALDIKPGDAVADLGAGGGYFTLQLARAVGTWPPPSKSRVSFNPL